MRAALQPWTTDNMRQLHQMLASIGWKPMSRTLREHSCTVAAPAVCCEWEPDLLLRRAKGNLQAEFGTLSWCALDVDRAAVDLGDMLDDGETQTRPTHFARAGSVDAIETLENSR